MNDTLIPLGKEVVSTWSITHGVHSLRGTIVGHGEIKDVDDDTYPCYLVALPERMFWSEELPYRNVYYRSVMIVVMRADRVEVVE